MARPRDAAQDPAVVEALAQALGLPSDAELLHTALTHPSYAHEHAVTHNQRLELLGDAVLGLCVAELLFERFPDEHEGTLTQMRAKLVNAEALHRIGLRAQIPAALRVSRGADALRSSQNVVADAVEALLAAVFLSLGWEGARAACRGFIEPELAELSPGGVLDPKSALQERLVGVGVPQYSVTEEGGPAHSRWFVVAVMVAEQVLGTGRGRSKRLAERAAAQAALESAELESLLGATR